MNFESIFKDKEEDNSDDGMTCLHHELKEDDVMNPNQNEDEDLKSCAQFMDRFVIPLDS